QRREPGVGHRDRPHRARPRIEQRQLAEHLARPEHTGQVLPAVRRGPGQLDLAVEHHVQPVPGVALLEQVFAPAELNLDHPGAQCLRRILVQRLEQRRPAEHVLSLFHGTSSFASRRSLLSVAYALPDSDLHLPYQWLPPASSASARRRRQSSISSWAALWP